MVLGEKRGNEGTAKGAQISHTVSKICHTKLCVHLGGEGGRGCANMTSSEQVFQR